MLFDLPLGWFDPEWMGCQADRGVVDDSRWQYLATNYLAMHSRYPKKPSVPKGSSLQRVLSVVDAFFTRCTGTHCLPKAGMSMFAYQAFDALAALSVPWTCYSYSNSELDQIYGSDRSRPWSEEAEAAVCGSSAQRVFARNMQDRSTRLAGCDDGCSCCIKTS